MAKMIPTREELLALAKPLDEITASVLCSPHNDEALTFEEINKAATALRQIAEAMRSEKWSRNRKGLVSIAVGGIWLRKHGDRIQVLAERPDGWRLCIEENMDSSFSHIIEPAGIDAAHAEAQKEE